MLGKDGGQPKNSAMIERGNIFFLAVDLSTWIEPPHCHFPTDQDQYGVVKMPVEYTKDTMKTEIMRNGHQVGEHTYGQPRVMQYGEDTRLNLGKYCSLAVGLTILLGGNHRYDWVSTYPFSGIPDIWPEAIGITGHSTSNGDVVIGNDVWIGLNVTIMSGVIVGDGAVIAAESVVTKNVKPYSIVGGNPAKILKMRFSDHIINKLLEICWWNWPEEEIRKALNLLSSQDIESFIEYSLIMKIRIVQEDINSLKFLISEKEKVILNEKRDIQEFTDKINVLKKNLSLNS